MHSRPECFTILGCEGLIGGHLAESIESKGMRVERRARLDESREPLGGHVIDCVGVTFDFRRRPLDAMEAHVARLIPLLRTPRFKSYLYLSSTRVYRHSAATHEDQALTIDPADPEAMYDLSKLAGEALVHACASSKARIARLSNVLAPSFSTESLFDRLVTEAVRTGRFTTPEHPDASRDYISIDDVVSLLPTIALTGRQRLYNVASGISLSNRDLVALVQAALPHVAIDRPDATTSATSGLPQPAIDTSRITGEFGYRPTDLRAQLIAWIRRSENAAHQGQLAGGAA